MKKNKFSFLKDKKFYLGLGVGFFSGMLYLVLLSSLYATLVEINKIVIDNEVLCDKEQVGVES